jgi:uncharacterized RDD family membrane protein YckC
MKPETNPYAPPASYVSDAEVERDRPIVTAGKGRRFGTYVVDKVCCTVLAFFVGLAIAALFGEQGVQATQSGWSYLIGALVMLLYYILFEGLWARTPGKFVCGTVVVNEHGGRPSLGQIVGRTFCRFIPFEAFSFLGERGWHDSIPNTHVVETR